MSILNTADAKSHTWKSQFKKKKTKPTNPNPKQTTNDPSKWLLVLMNLLSLIKLFEMAKSYLTGESSASDKKY